MNNGICVQCNEKNADDGMTQCEDCAAETRKVMQEYNARSEFEIEKITSAPNRLREVQLAIVESMTKHAGHFGSVVREVSENLDLTLRTVEHIADGQFDVVADITDDDIIIVKRDGDTDLQFAGELIAEAQSYQKGGRWTELKLWRTKAGKYIAEEVGVTTWQNEHDRHSATVCDTEADVIAALGTGWLAKELYESAGIACVEKID